MKININTSYSHGCFQLQSATCHKFLVLIILVVVLQVLLFLPNYHCAALEDVRGDGL